MTVRLTVRRDGRDIAPQTITHEYEIVDSRTARGELYVLQAIEALEASAKMVR